MHKVVQIFFFFFFFVIFAKQFVDEDLLLKYFVLLLNNFFLLEKFPYEIRFIFKRIYLLLRNNMNNMHSCISIDLIKLFKVCF